MSTNYISAIDTIFGQFRAAWEADAAGIVGLSYTPRVFYPNLPESKPDSSQFWARISTQTVLEGQASFASNVGSADSKRYTTHGLVFVQLFCPKTLPSSQGIGKRLAVLARDTFRKGSTDGEIVFRNSRINDSIPPEEQYIRFNVVAEYEYDEIQ